MSRKTFDEDTPLPPHGQLQVSGVRVRSDYRCRANGCPNAGCVDDVSEAHRGTCYWHWRELDARKWDAITQKIRGDFERMRNHGQPMQRSVEARGAELFEEEAS